jgi:type IV pilus assembly protein PilO
MLQKLNELATGAKAGIMLVIAGAIFAAGYFGPIPGVATMIEKNKADAETLKKKQDENQLLAQYVTKLGDLDRQIASLKQQMEFQKKIVPDEKEADKFIILLQDTATSAGVALRKLEAKSASTKEYYTEVPYTIELDGPYYGVLSFFDKLATQTRIVNVEALSMKSLSKTGKQFTYGPTDSVAVTATAKTFFSREQGASDTAAAPAKK